jgi:hypothetical protein
MGDEGAEAFAIRALLDDVDVTDALEELTSLRGDLEGPDASGGVVPPAVASPLRMVQGHRVPLSDAAQHQARRPDPNRARNKRRLELIHLRRQAAELEAHLDQLRRQQQASSESSSRVASPALTRHDHDERSEDSWESISHELRAKRLSAETENTRLRMLVDSHVKTTSRLRRILLPSRPRNARWYLSSTEDDQTSLLSRDVTPTQVRSSSSPTTAVTIQPSPALFTGIPSMTSPEIFAMLRRSVDRSRSDMDAVFVANGLAKAEQAYRSAKVSQDQVNGTMMELVASKVMPYSMDATARVVWRHFNDFLPQMPDRKSFQFRNEREVNLRGSSTATIDQDLVLTNSVVFSLGL